MIIKLAIALVVVLTVTAFAAWAFLPARHLPGNRARHLRIRLHLRLHPGKGFAHAFSLHLRWSRFAVLRRSGLWLRNAAAGLCVLAAAAAAVSFTAQFRLVDATGTCPWSPPSRPSSRTPPRWSSPAWA